LGVRPGQLEGSGTSIGIAVLDDQAHQLFARLGRNCNERDLFLLSRLDRKAPPDREHRIKDAAVSPVDRHYWILPTAISSKQARAIRFILEGGIVGGLSTMNCATQIGGSFSERRRRHAISACSSAALGLNEELAKGRCARSALWEKINPPR
jgi:hypothetical protein